MVFLTVLVGAWEGRISDTSRDPLLGTSALPLGVKSVSPPAVELAVVQIPRAPLRLYTFLMGPLVNLGFSVWASLLQPGLGKDVSRWRWSRSCHGGTTAGPHQLAPA
jgi:hypothetical protein